MTGKVRKSRSTKRSKLKSIKRPKFKVSACIICSKKIVIDLLRRGPKKRVLVCSPICRAKHWYNINGKKEKYRKQRREYMAGYRIDNPRKK